MKKELDEQLCREFPLLYRDRNASMTDTCMCWGFACGDGWFEIIYDLSKQLEPLIAAMPEECWCGHSKEDHKRPVKPIKHSKWGDYPEICEEFQDCRPRASQVKEKFGTLRFYMSTSTEEMEDLITVAENDSAVTCEECGGPGRTRGGGWVLTLCLRHHWMRQAGMALRSLKYKFQYGLPRLWRRIRRK